MSHPILAARLRPLQLCAAIALSVGSTAILAALPAAASKLTQTTPPPPKFISTCADDMTEGSLRVVLSRAVDGDVIDLSKLACSTITLQHGQLSSGAAITIRNSAPAVTIDAAHSSRALALRSTGIVTLQNLVIQGGAIVTTEGGGCISAAGTLYFYGSDAHDCSLHTPVYYTARGGGIYAAGKVRITASHVMDSHAIAADGYSAEGGGVWGENVIVTDSVISGNSADTSIGEPASGGGVFATNYLDIEYSTISNNTAKKGGGTFAESSTGVCASTITGNQAENGGGVYNDIASTEMYISNSTVTANMAASPSAAGGIYGGGGFLELYSSIVAGNTVTSNSAVASLDIVSRPGVSVSGERNILTQAPIGSLKETIVAADPKLGPLADNGGPTPTRRLLDGSPALGKGSIMACSFDQRGLRRTQVDAVDIGAIQDTLFRSAFDPPGHIQQQRH